jgi:hypothetical protein
MSQAGQLLLSAAGSLLNESTIAGAESLID